MATLKIMGQSKIQRIKKQFKKDVGVDIQIYDQDGNKASDDISLGSIRSETPKSTELKIVGQAKVKTVEKYFQDNYGVKVDILNPDGTLADNDVTLSDIRKLYEVGDSASDKTADTNEKGEIIDKYNLEPNQLSAFKVIQNSGEEGVGVAILKEDCGMDAGDVSNALSKLLKLGIIKSKGLGVYIINISELESTPLTQLNEHDKNPIQEGVVPTDGIKNTKDIIDEISSILFKMIDENVEQFREEGECLVKTKYGNGEYYMNQVEGSYDSALQGLIHYIMYEENLYPIILDEKQMKDLKILIEDDPEAIYGVDPEEEEKTQEILDEIYWDVITEVGKKLEDIGFDVDEFDEYLEDE